MAELLDAQPDSLLLVYGLAWLAVAIWALRRRRILEQHAGAAARQLRLQLALTLAAFAATLGAGWLLTDYLGRKAEQAMRDEARSGLNLLTSRLRMETGMAESVARAMTDSPWVLPALAAPDAAGQFVDAFWSAAGEAATTYLVNADGIVVSSSNRFNADSPVGRNDRMRPYFQAAIAGECAHDYAVGVTTRERDYYASCPVRDRSGHAVGVAVVEKTLDSLETDLRQFEHAYLVDANGVVFLASGIERLFTTLWPVSERAREALARSRQFGEVRAEPLVEREIADGTWIGLQGERHYAGRRYIGDGRWSFVMLRAGTPVAAGRALGIAVTLLFALLSLAYLVRMEQLARDRIALATRLELEEHARELDLRASTDALTGVANRSKFNQELGAEVERARRYATPLSLVLCDVDHFKAINDTHGHQTGDSVLIAVCRLIEGHIRKTDLLARWGGEEFVVLVRNCAAGDAHDMAEKLRLMVAAEPYERVGRITCSFGVTQFRADDSAESALARADAALYRAKQGGRNRVERGERLSAEDRVPV